MLGIPGLGDLRIFGGKSAAAVPFEDFEEKQDRGFVPSCWRKLITEAVACPSDNKEAPRSDAGKSLLIRSICKSLLAAQDQEDWGGRGARFFCL